MSDDVGATILLVEDAPELAQIITRELIASGYRVVHTANGRAALDLYGRQPIDLVILDWMLPGLDGLTVLRRLRDTSATPVLMLTARGEEADRVIGLEVGADDYLTKPFSMRELVARVHALLRRATVVRQALAADRTAPNRPVMVGGLRLDRARHLATLDDRPLDLTPLEFALLHLLATHPGRVFSRSYLLETVWTEQYVGGDRAVDNSILRLRKKLGSFGDAIETVWGIGYRLRAPATGATPSATA